MCMYCEELNEEKEFIETDTIKISRAGYFNYHMPIIHCPACGTILDKYKNMSKEEINNILDHEL